MKANLSLVLSAAVCNVVLRFWEPAALRNNADYSQLGSRVLSIGPVPFGRTVAGPVVIVPSEVACSSLLPFKTSRSFANPVLVLQEGVCSWEMKILHAQEAGAKLTLLVDPRRGVKNENDRIVDRIQIPSVVIQKEKLELLEQVIAMQERLGSAILMAEFRQLEIENPSEIRFRAKVDQAASYDTLLLLGGTLSSFTPECFLLLRFEIQDSSETTNSLAGNCSLPAPESFCIASGSENQPSGLLEATLALLCLGDEAPAQLFPVVKNVRSNCFDPPGLPKIDFSQCIRENLAQHADISECLASTEKRGKLLKNNMQQDAVGGDSPLVFINGQLIRKDRMNSSGFLEAVCAGYLPSMPGCESIAEVKLQKTKMVGKLLGFGLICMALGFGCIFAVVWILRTFYRRRLKRDFNNKLDERINAALEKYYGHASGVYRFAPGPNSS